MPTKAQKVQNRRITTSKVYVVVLIVLFVLASIKWIRKYKNPDKANVDTIDEIAATAEIMLVPVLLFGIGLLMFTSGIFASIGVVFMVASAVMFGYALYKVIQGIKDNVIEFIDPINPFSS